ncbi:hypothetical protein [Janibacter indicus]|uniref:hypothetical protein n=1 Tax=Janibacter indicus TaxID=857417 RepID=UPI003D9A94A4
MTQADVALDRGAALFNNRLLAVVVVAIAGRDDSEFTTRQLAKACGVADSLVRPVLRRLADAGMIQEHSRRGGVRGELLYRIRDEEGWELLASLCQRLPDT